MRAFDCPNCGAGVPFDSNIAVFATCAFCSSMVVRRDVDVESLGIQAILPADMSPIQPGTRGRFRDQGFRVLGRVRMQYPEGSWNEWYVEYEDGRWGWIAESQGFYEISFEVSVPPETPGADTLPPAGVDKNWQKPGPRLLQSGLALGRAELVPGRTLVLHGRNYRVTDTKQTSVVGSEGILPFAAIPGRSAISGDLRGIAREFANLEYSEEGIRLFIGEVHTFSELQFSGCRAVPGWSDDPSAVIRGQTTPLSCPNCGAVVELRALGASVTATCGSCRSLVDVATPEVNATTQELRLIQTATSRTRLPALIPVGTRGVLNDITWECIGFLRRHDEHGGRWDEYLLYNPYHGYRWLVQSYGHWVVVDRELDHVDDSGGGLEHQGTQWRRFSEYWCFPTYVYGEFYWRVRLRERTRVTELIAPPEGLAREAYPELAEVTWSRGRYIEPAVIQQAFAIGKELPEKKGVFPLQPNPHTDAWQRLRFAWLLLLGVFLLMEFIVWGYSDGKTRLKHAFRHVEGTTNSMQITPVFEVSGSQQNLEITSSASLQNAWAELDILLIETNTGMQRSLVQEVSFYSGTDSGEYWSEGNFQNSRRINAVPPGKYYLAIEPEGEPGLEAEMAVTVRQRVFSTGNLFIGLLLLSAYPLWISSRKVTFEKNRWAESDFSPETWTDRISEGFDFDGEDD